MKKIILLLCLLVLLLGCKSKKPVMRTAEGVKVVKLAPPEIDENQKKIAYDLGKRILTACNTSTFKPFNESEATPMVIQNTTKERITKTCLKFRLKYGDFKDLHLAEIIKNKKDQSTTFRYKALYQKKIANKELRVTLNSENKVSAIKSLDWKAAF